MPETISLDKAALAWNLTWDSDWVTAVCFLGPTRRIAAGNNLGQILVWDLPEKMGAPVPSPVRRLDGHTNVISRLLATSDGRWLISSSYDHTVRFWDMQAAATANEALVLNARAIADAQARKGNGAKVPPALNAKVDLQPSARTFDGHKEWVTAMSMSKDEKIILTGDDNGTVVLWERESGKEVQRWKTKGWVNGAALSPDAKQAFISERVPLVFDSGRHSATKLWDAATGQVQKDLDADFKGQFLGSAAYSPDGKLLAVGRNGEVDGLSGKVTLLDPATGKKVRELTPAHQYGVTDLAFHPDGQHLASAGRDTIVRLWNTADGKMLKEIGKPRGGQFKDWVCAVAFSADGRWLAAADMAGAVQVWSFIG
jgi:WD40 repeat protein